MKVSRQEIAQAQADLARLKREQAYGIAHPHAGYCGEDDARADLIDDLEVWLREVWDYARP